MTDILIIGAGTAGLTAGIYAARAGKSVKILESTTYGGQIINTPDIENYPGFAHISGYEFAQNLYEQAAGLGVEVEFAEVTSVTDGQEKHVETADGKTYAAKAIILATGAKNRPLGIAREKELIGRGISYCATCDGMFFRGKDTAVNGGGNTALEDALYLADLADTVYLIHRRDSFRGEETTVKRLAERENVHFVYNSRVTALNADKRLRSIEVTNNDGAVTTLEVNGLFVAVGRIPENRNFAAVAELDDAGYAVAGENCRTKTPGVFVAGDNRVKDVRQLVTATADGAVAATEAVKYLGAM